jgi:tRNA (guanosine-2'-O-)-methyltransferase
MDRVNKPHNFSAIVRNCDAAGVLEAHIVAVDRALELHHATSAGTKKWVAVRRHESVVDAIAHLKARGFFVLAAHVSAGAIDYRDFDYTQPVAIMVGAELEGISPEALARADACAAIPMMGMVHSLNVSVASALLLFEAMRQRSTAGMYDRSRLEPGEFERRLFEWAYPALARRLRQEGRPYPVLDEEGRIATGSRSSRPS